MTVRFVWIIAFLSALSAVRTSAQEVDVGQPLAVFLDCNTRSCDFDHFRRAIPWVTWVRDREASDIHLLITSQRTGGGGRRFTLDYIGRSDYEGTEKSLTYTSDPDDTDAEVRDGLTQTMALGLVQFAETTPVAGQLRVVFVEADVEQVQQAIADDPWNLWVFRLGVDGSLDGEASERSYSFTGSAEADRVSDDLKIQIELEADYEFDEFELDDGSTVTNKSEDHGFDVLSVWSLGPHWSAGGIASATRSTFLNRRLGVTGGPAIEYNIFPYSESTRRALTFTYAIEIAGFVYELETVARKTEEILPRHRLRMSTEVQQPWGQIDGSVTATQYLHDLSVHRIDTFLRLEYRLFRGFNLDVFGRFSRIKDQFFLPAGGLTDEEVLLRRRQRETDFRYNIGVGFSYRFGSQLANVVNPRLQ